MGDIGTANVSKAVSKRNALAFDINFDDADGPKEVDMPDHLKERISPKKKGKKKRKGGKKSGGKRAGGPRVTAAELEDRMMNRLDRKRSNEAMLLGSMSNTAKASSSDEDDGPVEKTAEEKQEAAQKLLDAKAEAVRLRKEQREARMAEVARRRQKAALMTDAERERADEESRKAMEDLNIQMQSITA